MKWRSKKFLWGSIIVVVLVGVGVATMSGSGDDSTEVQADLAILDEISEIVSASGRVQPQTKVNITAEVSAQIMAVYVKDGERVEQGQPLILLDTVQLNSDVAQAKYSLEEVAARTAGARSTHERDKLEYERLTRLHDQKLAAERDYTNAKFAHRTSEANYNAMKAQKNTARARLVKAEDNLSKTHIVAPMAGVVTFLGAEIGEIAQAQTSFTQGKTLLTVSDLSVFEVEVDVDETEVAKLKVDQIVEISVDAFADTTYNGRVIEIGNSARTTGEGTEEYTTNFMAKVRFIDLEPGLRPGMSATVDITTARVDEALIIPYAAVVTRTFDDSGDDKDKETEETSGGVQAAETDEPADSEDPKVNVRKKDKKEKLTGVFVYRDGKAEFIEITTGIADDRNIVALTGLVPGDTVISGSFKTLRKLERGESVTIEERSIKKINGEDD